MDQGAMNMTDHATSPHAEHAMAGRTLSVADLVGRYAYRFNGFAMSNNILKYLVGVGQFHITKDGSLTGHHKSSITALAGQAAKLQTGDYDLSGTIELEAAGMGFASIDFKPGAGGGLEVVGKFYVQVAGKPDRLWFISAGETLPTRNSMDADELVTLEAVRMV
jgi:hypothetical protein